MLIRQDFFDFHIELMSESLQLGMVGLGRMGGNIVRRLTRAGHRCVGFDADANAAQRLRPEDIASADTLEELVRKLDAPRAIWVMLPHGDITERCISDLAALMAPGDILIDGGNSFYQDDVRRARSLQARGIGYLDVGTSGGVRGLERGYCLMIGGDRPAFDRLEPLFAALAPGRGTIDPTPGREQRRSTAEAGYLHCGPAGAGHFVKMIHNGIEYGVMEALAEGFEILKGAGADRVLAERRYDLDLADIAEVWRRGSVISSWLLDLTADALAESPALAQYSGRVEDSGEGRWTVQAAIDEDVAADVLTTALFKRFRSRQHHTFAEKMLSAMRYKFGGHVEAPKPDR
jgi:6-phosphogluconate dehydrogenase